MLLETTAANGSPILLYLWQGYEWVSKGPFNVAVEDDDPIEWDCEGVQPTLRILQVCLIHIYNIAIKS